MFKIVPGIQLNIKGTDKYIVFKSGKDIIQDRTIYEDAHIFAPNLHAMGLMTNRDFENYSSLFQSTVFKMITPYIRVASQLIGIFPEEARRMTIR